MFVVYTSLGAFARWKAPSFPRVDDDDDDDDDDDEEDGVGCYDGRTFAGELSLLLCVR